MDPPAVLEGLAGMDSLEEGQQIILELPQEGDTGTGSVIMEVVRVEGNQIHFMASGSADSAPVEKFSMEEGPDGKFVFTPADDTNAAASSEAEHTDGKIPVSEVSEHNANTEQNISSKSGRVKLFIPDVGARTSPGSSEIEEIRLPDIGSIGDDDGVNAANVKSNESEIEFVSTERTDGEEERDAEELEDSTLEGEDLDEVTALTCFICQRRVGVVTYLLLGRTISTKCSLAERLVGCMAPVKLNVSTADAVCTSCEAIINDADSHYFQYQKSSKQLVSIVAQHGPHPGVSTRWRNHSSLHPGGQLPVSVDPPPEEVRLKVEEDDGDVGGVGGEVEKEVLPQETPLLGPPQEPPLLVPPNYRPKRPRKPSPRGDGEDSEDEDWTPSLRGTPPRTSRGRRPKVRRVWSPETSPSLTEKRGRGRPKKMQPQELKTPEVEDVATPPPRIIEYKDVDALKEQVKDINTKKFSLKLNSRPLKADLERIVHLDIRTVDGSPTPISSLASPRKPTEATVAGRGDIYECRRCNIEFKDSVQMVLHLRQHVNKPWCKRCRTEFNDRQTLLDHRKDCRMKHRAALAGFCAICNKEVKYRRYHMRRHNQLIQDGKLEENQPLPNEEDLPPPAYRSSGKSIAGGVCSICGEYVPERLRKHEKNHNITNTCPICKKVFTREDVVRGHISRVHLKERPHVCSHCGKTFVSVFSLQRHEMIHNNEFRFYCQECGEGFRQKQQLTSHMRHKHGVVDVVFEDVQVMPEDEVGVVNAMSVVAEPAADLRAQVLEPLDDKGEFVIAATTESGDDGEEFTAVQDADGRIYRVQTSD